MFVFRIQAESQYIPFVVVWLVVLCFMFISPSQVQYFVFTSTKYLQTDFQNAFKF